MTLTYCLLCLVQYLLAKSLTACHHYELERLSIKNVDESNLIFRALRGPLGRTGSLLEACRSLHHATYPLGKHSLVSSARSVLLGSAISACLVATALVESPRGRGSLFWHLTRRSPGCGLRPGWPAVTSPPGLSCRAARRTAVGGG